MRPARDLGNRIRLAAGPIEPIEAGVGVCLHQSSITRQMLFRMFGAAIRRVKEGDGRRIRTSKWPIVPDIGPQPPGPGLSLGQNPNGGVVGVDALGRKHLRPDQKDEWHQGRCRRTDPVGQRRDIEIDTLACIDGALAVERQVKAIFGEQDVCQQAGSGTSARDRV